MDCSANSLPPLGTYKAGGVDHQMRITKGSGVTRIDTILGNRTAAHAVTGIMYQWDISAGMDHVALTAVTNQSAYSEKVEKFI